MTHNPVATITMQNGKRIVVELYPEVAPNTVNNFISLANSGFYNGLVFSPCNTWIYDSGRLSQRHRNGRTRLLHQGRVFKKRLQKPFGTHTWRNFHGTGNEIPTAQEVSFSLCTKTHPTSTVPMPLSERLSKVWTWWTKLPDEYTDFNDRPYSEQKIKSVTVETFGVNYPAPVKA